jgi:hypothetical protein
MLGLPVVAWLDHLLRQAGKPELTFLLAVNVPLVVAASGDQHPRRPPLGGWNASRGIHDRLL